MQLSKIDMDRCCFLFSNNRGRDILIIFNTRSDGSSEVAVSSESRTDNQEK